MLQKNYFEFSKKEWNDGVFYLEDFFEETTLVGGRREYFVEVLTSDGSFKLHFYLSDNGNIAAAFERSNGDAVHNDALTFEGLSVYALLDALKAIGRAAYATEGTISITDWLYALVRCSTPHNSFTRLAQAREALIREGLLS